MFLTLLTLLPLATRCLAADAFLPEHSAWDYRKLISRGQRVEELISMLAVTSGSVWRRWIFCNRAPTEEVRTMCAFPLEFYSSTRSVASFKKSGAGLPAPFSSWHAF